MYTSFRKNLEIGCSSDFKCFYDFTKHETNMDMEMVLLGQGKGGSNKEDVQDDTIKNGNAENTNNCRVFKCNCIQARLVVRTRRRGRGDMGVLTNAEMHRLNGNRGNFMDALFQNIPGRQSKLKDKKLAITSILEKFKPALLGLAEPTTEEQNAEADPDDSSAETAALFKESFTLN